ncbi:response regulator [Cystobacter fuscus]
MPGEKSPMKVLLVEDDAGLREGMAELIAEQTPVREAGSVAEALRVLQEESFALVLTDLRIGDSGGGGRIILEAARKRLQPVAIVSASTAEEVVRVLRPHEPDAVLNKPFQIEDMMLLVERFVRLRREVERPAAGAVPPEDTWTTEPTTGLRLSQRPDGGLWMRLAPGASHRSPVSRGHAALVVEGSLEVDGETRGRDHYFFLAAGPRELRTQEGVPRPSRSPWTREFLARHLPGRGEPGAALAARGDRGARGPPVRAQGRAPQALARRGPQGRGGLGGQERRFTALVVRELSRHQRLLDLAARTLGHAPSKIGLLEDQALVRYVLWRRLFCGATWARIGPEVKLPGPVRPRTLKDDFLERVAQSPLAEPSLPESVPDRPATRYSFPTWLVQRLAELHPEPVLEAMLAALDEEPSLHLRARPRAAATRCSRGWRRRAWRRSRWRWRRARCASPRRATRFSRRG